MARDGSATLRGFTPQTLAVAGGLAAAAALALAYASEHWGGLAPCALCIWQRWPYWAAVAAALAALALPRAGLPLAGLIALFFLGNAGLAAFHAGVEWRLWPTPFAACGPGALAPAASVDELMARLAATPIVRCDDPAIVVAGLSMAGWNALFALAVGAGLIISLARIRRTE